MTEAKRTVPTKRYGNIPVLDDHITRTRAGDPAKRYTVGGKYFSNLTLARMQVIETKGIKVDHGIDGLFRDVDYTTQGGWKKHTAKPGTPAPQPSRVKKAVSRAKKRTIDHKLAVAAQAAAQEQRVIERRNTQKVTTARTQTASVKPNINGTYTVKVTERTYQVENVSSKDLASVCKSLGINK